MTLLANIETVSHGENIIAKDIHFQIPAGEVLSMYGPSGCGKTTVLRILAGMHSNYTGQVLMDSTNVGKRRVGFVQQNVSFFRWMSTKNNMLFGACGDDTKAIIDLVGLSEEALDAYPNKLSGGMRQRMALGRALVSRPDLLLLDEPFSALDFDATDKLLDLLYQIAQELALSIVMVSHDPIELASISDSIVVLGNEGEASPSTIIHVEKITIPRPDRSLELQGQTAQILKEKLSK